MVAIYDSSIQWYIVVVYGSGIRWYMVVVYSSSIGFRALVSLLLNKLHRTRSIPILVSYIVNYIDREVIPYIERDIRLILAIKQYLNNR